MVDLMRGRLTQRLSLQLAAAKADIPESLQKYVIATVRATGLRRTEQVEVVRELVEHFEDGVAHGRSPEELIRLFGDAKVAARLIGRAKRRARPMVVRVLTLVLQTSAVVMGAVLLSYIALFVRSSFLTPNIARNFVAEQHASVSKIPETDRAWPLYRRAFLELPPAPDKLLKAMPVDGPSTEQWQVAKSYVDQAEASIDLIIEGSTKASLGSMWRTDNDAEMKAKYESLGLGSMPLIESASASEMPTWIVELPHLWCSSNLSKLLMMHARLAIEDGDSAIFVRDVQAQLNISAYLFGERRSGEHLAGNAGKAIPSAAPPAPAESGSMVVEQMTGFRLRSLAIREITRALDLHADRFSEAQLLALGDAVHGWRGGHFDISTDGDRVMFYDLLQRMYTDDGNGRGRLTNVGLRVMSELQAGSGAVVREATTADAAAAPIAGLFMADRKEMRATYERVLRAQEDYFQIPIWQRPLNHIVRDYWDEVKDDRVARFKYTPAVMMLPYIGNAYAMASRGKMERDALHMAIAAELWKRRHGEYPSSLDEMPAEWLPNPPIDQYTGTPLRYTIVSGKPLIYSVGTDFTDNGGLRDEGGTEEPDAAATWEKVSPRRPSDLILYPP